MSLEDQQQARGFQGQRGLSEKLALWLLCLPLLCWRRGRRKFLLSVLFSPTRKFYHLDDKTSHENVDL